MHPPHRRTFLHQLGALPLLACGGGNRATPDGTIGDSALIDWAGGGTAAMTDKATYPDPFAVAPTSCVIVASTTRGPCTTATDLVREDISEGWRGIPVRLALQIVDGACAPLVGATVRIWHTNIEGSYSGVTPNPALCLLESAYSAEDFHRGVGTTSSAGTVFFDTCFPGWYGGRAIHIHFEVAMGAMSTRVSQLFFPEDVTQGIFARHPEYTPFGQPDTIWATDGVMRAIAASARHRVTLDVAPMTDGAMLASKVVTVV